MKSHKWKKKKQPKNAPLHSHTISYRTLAREGLDLPEDGVGEKESFLNCALKLLVSPERKE